MRAEQFQRGRSVACFDDMESFLPQHLRDRHPQSVFILHDENRPRCGPLLISRRTPDRFAAQWGRLAGARQVDADGRALARRADEVDSSAVISNDALYYREAQTPAREFCREERIKDFRLHLRRHAAAGVRNFEFCIISRRQIGWTAWTGIPRYDYIRRGDIDYAILFSDC